MRLAIPAVAPDLARQYAKLLRKGARAFLKGGKRRNPMAGVYVAERYLNEALAMRKRLQAFGIDIRRSL